jgi:hypothetical protein
MNRKIHLFFIAIVITITLSMSMTVNKATLEEASKQLRLMGVRDDIITIDGGSSTYLFNSRFGDMLKPFTSDTSSNVKINNLPHYLGFHLKN